MAFELADSASLAQWLSWQESLHGKEIDLGLERVARVAQSLGLIADNDQLSGPLLCSDNKAVSKVVTIAGTNGKGSCAATLEALALSKHDSVGVYSSPHFHRYNERIRINGVDVADDDIISAFKAIDRAREAVSLSYFEFGTLAALWLFSQASLDWVILEVGLGGRLDAVNIIDADLAVVTSIGLDHQDWLGTDLHQIGREKAGVMRPGKPAINMEARHLSGIVEVANETQAKLLCVGQDFTLSEAEDRFDLIGLTGSSAHVEDPNSQESLSDTPLPQALNLNLPLPSLPLASVAAAILAFSHYQALPDLTALERLVSNLSLAGRFERHQLDKTEIILDVAHNPDAAQLLVSRLEGQYLAVFAVMADKDLAEIVAPLEENVSHWYCCDLSNNPRAAKANGLADFMTSRGQTASSWASVSDALNAAIFDSDVQPEKILVVGSFFTVADARDWIFSKYKSS